ncbi:hypothetical protein NCAS_0I02210 [Naumovozyma castellii]|uniref:Phosphatidylglycerol/phosphatidylinositol transfer protein n=1 Tax=Naumovozyma castellii TaxID=27288 RepID=G0VK55_NAUCA|nr:hypothetical protein NCAS_0I02210 [Naumovozyma castellii CBS 4309]CCC71889.1 hypothetical protein NCAS_0I02210 [Naumovozyma castellii CBS 4309]
MQLTYIFVTILTLYTTLSRANILPGPPATDRRPIHGDSPLYQCDIYERQILNIENVDLSPNPPKRNSKLNITASGEAFKEIKKGAYIDIVVRLGYIKLLTQTFDLCDMLEDEDVEGLRCPVQPGKYNLAKSVDIPAEVPPGRYIFSARAYTVDDELITCITGEVLFPATY